MADSDSETTEDREEWRRLASHTRQSEPIIIVHLLQQPENDRSAKVSKCVWCGASMEDETMYRCREACRGGMVACATCILVGHWEAPLHRLQVWSPGSRIWEPATLRQLGFIFQEGHQGLPCPNPAPTTTTKLL
ncbi:hypothetical protein B0H14DRAFT_3465979 [Mycena olivaceomarginata]|nr:hypothetical protein B0H14DRAFT_3465979 [Mycena olivaceomarginata]